MLNHAPRSLSWIKREIISQLVCVCHLYLSSFSDSYTCPFLLLRRYMMGISLNSDDRSRHLGFFQAPVYRKHAQRTTRDRLVIYFTRVRRSRRFVDFKWKIKKYLFVYLCREFVFVINNLFAI